MQILQQVTVNSKDKEQRQNPICDKGQTGKGSKQEVQKNCFNDLLIHKPTIHMVALVTDFIPT